MNEALIRLPTVCRSTPVASARHAQRLVLWVLLCGITLLLFVLVRGFLFQTFYVVSDSMAPTLFEGDRILVFRAAYQGPMLLGTRPAVPQQGDVVVFSRFSEFQEPVPGQQILKRIAAVPGEVIAVQDAVLLRGEQLAEGNHYEYGPLRLGPNQYFVTGDNSSTSKDSRFYGPIRREDIAGKAIAVIWSNDPAAGSRVRWSRVGKLL